MKLKRINKLVYDCSKELRESDCSFRTIYKLMFRRTNAEMTESTVNGETVIMTFGQADKEIGKIASSLVKRFGSGGNFIGLYGDNCNEWLITFWAILRSGNKPYLINIRQPNVFSEDMLDTLGAVGTVSVNSVCPIEKNTVYYWELESESDGIAPDMDITANEIALSTSGTTLKKKICIYTGYEISCQILNSRAAMGVNPRVKATYKREIKLLAFLPLYHIFGLEASYFWFQFFGVSIVFPESLAPDDILSAIRNHNVTHVFAVPLFWHTVERSVRREVAARSEKTSRKFEKALKLCLKVQKTCPKFGILLSKMLLGEVRRNLFGKTVKFCITGGSYVRPEATALVNGLGYPLFNGYGMTEIGIACADFSERGGYRLTPSVGKPFKSVEMKIGESGTLLVRGESICKKIIIDGNVNAVKPGEWFDTGDLAEIRDGGRIYLTGRVSDLVVDDNGENLNPELIQKNFTIPGATEFCVTGDADNKQLMLVVHIPCDLTDEEFRTVRDSAEKCNGNLPVQYAVKSVKYTYDALMDPKDIKISRANLRRMINEGTVKLFSAENRKRIADADPETVAKIRAIFAEVLGLKESELDCNANFMTELGGTSLDYFEVICQVNREFGVTLSFETEEKNYSVNDIAKTVAKQIQK